MRKKKAAAKDLELQDLREAAPGTCLEGSRAKACRRPVIRALKDPNRLKPFRVLLDLI